MTASICPHFSTCSAPICPEDPGSMANCAWFPGEETCCRADLKGTPWIVKQRRIARAVQKDFTRGCFTVAMLEGITAIGKGTRGLDPEEPIIPERVKKWLSKFKGKKALTEEQKASLRAKLAKAREACAARDRSATGVVKVYGESDEG